MKARLIVLFFLLNLSTASQASGLKPFKTDYCTNYPEGTLERSQLWKHCCLLHDLTFWAGGNKQNRVQADLDLRICVEETGAIYQARLIYYAVRFGSLSPLKYPDKKWGNGWNGRPEYLSLTSEEMDEIEKELWSDYDFISVENKEIFILNLRSRLD